MLDGRVLEASQVEYKPFGKPPLKREVAGRRGWPDARTMTGNIGFATPWRPLFKPRHIPEQAVILENLVVNGIKTPFGNVVALSLEGDLDLNHFGNPL